MLHILYIQNAKHYDLGLTIEELRALGIAILHLFTLVSSCLHVTICSGINSCPRLHQELTDLNVVAGSSTMKGGPGDG